MLWESFSSAGPGDDSQSWLERWVQLKKIKNKKSRTIQKENLRGSKRVHYLKRETSSILFFQLIILCWFLKLSLQNAHVRPWIHEDISRLKDIVCGCNITKCQKILGVCILWKFSNNSLWINSDKLEVGEIMIGPHYHTLMHLVVIRETLILLRIIKWLVPTDPETLSALTSRTIAFAWINLMHFVHFNIIIHLHGCMWIFCCGSCPQLAFMQPKQ